MSRFTSETQGLGTMEDLPDELLLRILDLLPNSDIIEVVPCVCLRWSRLSLDSHIWRNRRYYVITQTEDVKFFSRKPPLRLVTLGQVDEAVLRNLASHCPTITSLRLDVQQVLTPDTFRVVTRNCVQIREFSVSSEVLSCPEIAREVALMPRLKTLTVQIRQHLQPRVCYGYARSRHLDQRMAGNFLLGDLGAPLLGRLQGLSISCMYVSRDIVHCAESLEKLKLYCPYGCSRPDSALAEDLLPLKALTHVDASCSTAGPQTIRALMKPLLRSINLMSIDFDDDLLLELCRRCPLLEDLDLSGCRITARGFSSLWSLRRLRRLCLDWCKYLGSGTMTHLAHCDGLQELGMQGVDMVCIEDVVPQLLQLTTLRVLEFEAWSVRDLIPWEMFPKAFPHLRTLNLGLWESQDTSLPESLKAAMPRTQVKWHNSWDLRG